MLLRGLLKRSFNLLSPFSEDFLEGIKHLDVSAGAHGKVSNVILVLSWILLERDVGRQGPQSLLELFSELVKHNSKLTFLVRFTNAPVINGKLINQWLINVVDEGVQGPYRVLIDLSEENLSIKLVLLVDRLPLRSAAKEITSFASQFDSLA